MKNKKIIAAGHICIDITPVFSEKNRYRELGELLVPGKLVHVKQAEIHTGGSVANTGLALKVLGNDVRLMGKIGDDAFGGMIRQIAGSYGAGGLVVDPDCSTSYTVVVAVPGIDRFFLHNPGANDTFSSQDIPGDALEDTALFHFGYPPLMRRMYQQDGEELLAIFRRMKEKGIATSLDMAAVDPFSEAGQADWETILRRALPYVDFFVPSFEEICFMLDREKYDALSAGGGDITEKLDMKRDAEPLAERLLELGCGAVLLKCGTAGICYAAADRERMAKSGERLGLDVALWADQRGIQPCFQADVVRSATGAGDASIAAFLTAVLQGKAPRECVALAAAEGACAVTSYDALSGLKPLDELEKRIRSGWKTGMI